MGIYMNLYDLFTRNSEWWDIVRCPRTHCEAVMQMMGGMGGMGMGGMGAPGYGGPGAPGAGWRIERELEYISL